MDLLSSIRKEGSRGGVDFKWADVSTSSHRENYLGHSLMAPVGRWQKNKDLSWYAKADSDAKDGNGETAEEKRLRERKEEIRKIKEAEEDALARALGLPVADRGLTGANAVSVGEMKRVIKETEEGDEEVEEVGKAGRRFGDFVGKVGPGEVDAAEAREDAIDEMPEQGGLMQKDDADGKLRPSRREKESRRRDRSRSHSRERGERRHRHHHRERRHREGDERHRHRDGDERHKDRRARSRSPDWRDRERGHRSKSNERHTMKRDDRDRRRSRERTSRRSRSPERRDRDRRRDEDGGRRRH